MEEKHYIHLVDILSLHKNRLILFIAYHRTRLISDMHVCLTVNFSKIFFVSPIALALTSAQFKFVVNQAREMIKGENKDMMIFSII